MRTCLAFWELFLLLVGIGVFVLEDLVVVLIRCNCISQLGPKASPSVC
jgi:hypothetical protein